MGLFLSLSGVIGKPQDKVIDSLTNYVKSVNGGLELADISNEHENFSVVGQSNGNTCILYPFHYLEWDNTSEFISRELQTTVFSCHIHDEDLWMFELYNNGQMLSQFNPIPEYWDENMSKKEIDSWKGDANTVCKFVPNCKPKDIEKYFRHWNMEDESTEKAYEHDEFTYGDCWQLVDFLNKLGLAYPLDDDGKATGKVFKLWTEKHKIEEPKAIGKGKPWWKFW